MGFFNKYPYLDEHELNLDWLLKRMKELDIRMDEFEVVNHISFSGAWDITKQYPAWTIVSDNNIGYVSIRPVPAGVLLTDGNYWRAVIDYTAQIAGLQTRVVALENTVGDASSGLVKDVDDLQNDVSLIQNDITSIQNDINLINNPIVLLISDSYGVNSVTPTRFSWFDRFELLSDIEVKKEALGGASFCGNNVNKYLDCLNNIIVTLSDAEKLRVKSIIIGGGYNDTMFAGSYADTVTAINNFKSACSIFTNLEDIDFYFIGATADPSNIMTMYFKRLELEKALVTQGVSYYYIGNIIHDYEDYIQSDGIHPTQDGSILIGAAIKSLYENKSAKITPDCNKQITLTCSSHAGVSNMTIREFSGNGKIILSLGDTTFTKGSADGNPLVFNATTKGLALPVKQFQEGSYLIIDGTGQMGLIIVDTNSNYLRIILRPFTASNWTSCKLQMNIEIDDFYC